MNIIPATIFVALGAVTAALITGAFSYFNLVSSKESKVSEFRQAWIDALRKEISTFVARMQVISSLLQGNQNSKIEGKDDLKLEVFQQYGEARIAYSAIHLRINKYEKDPEAKALNDDFILALEKANSCYEEHKFEEMKCCLENVVRTASAVLKMEWNRVRDGEPGYRAAKKHAIGQPFFVLVLALVLAWLLLSNYCVRESEENGQVKKAAQMPHNNSLKADAPVGLRP